MSDIRAVTASLTSRQRVFREYCFDNPREIRELVWLCIFVLCYLLTRCCCASEIFILSPEGRWGIDGRERCRWKNDVYMAVSSRGACALRLRGNARRRRKSGFSSAFAQISWLSPSFFVKHHNSHYNSIILDWFSLLFKSISIFLWITNAMIMRCSLLRSFLI